MNVVDLITVEVVEILCPIIGVILATQHNANVALMLANYIEGETPGNIANMISTSSAAGGVIPGNSTEDISGLVPAMVDGVA